MKKMNIVRNTITEGTETYRERSRIGSINHRIWSVIAPMLFIAFGLFGVNVEAWATWPTYSGTITTPDNGVTYYVLVDNEEHTLAADFGGESHEYNLGGPSGSMTFYAMKSGKTGTTNLYLKAFQDNTEKGEV